MVLLIPEERPCPGSAGHAAALAVQETRTISEPSTLDDLEALRAAAIVIRPQQLKDWVLIDLQDLDATH